jgi:hypothetical protein
MTPTPTADLPNFRLLMREVQLGDMTPEGAAAAIDEYIRQEVARRILQGLDVELALHPLGIVQDCADRANHNQARLSDRMVATLLREYAMLRRRMADDRLRAMVEFAYVPMPAKNAEQQLLDKLRLISQGG